MSSIITAMSILAIKMGTMVAAFATVIECRFDVLCRGMLAGIPSRDTSAVRGIPMGTGGGDHSSPVHATDRGETPGKDAEAGLHAQTEADTGAGSMKNDPPAPSRIDQHCCLLGVQPS